MNANGFSLLELIVVLAILGIAGAAVAPSLANTKSANDGPPGVAELATVLRSARRISIQNASVVAVDVDPSRSRYLMREMHASGRAAVVAEGLLPRVVPFGKPEVPRLHVVFERGVAVRADSVLMAGAPRPVFVGVRAWTGEVHVTLPKE